MFSVKDFDDALTVVAVAAAPWTNLLAARATVEGPLAITRRVVCLAVPEYPYDLGTSIPCGGSAVLPAGIAVCICSDNKVVGNMSKLGTSASGLNVIVEVELDLGRVSTLFPSRTIEEVISVQLRAQNLLFDAVSSTMLLRLDHDVPTAVSTFFDPFAFFRVASRPTFGPEYLPPGATSAPFAGLETLPPHNTTVPSRPSLAPPRLGAGVAICMSFCLLVLLA